MAISEEGDVAGASVAFSVPVVKVTGTTTCRCRNCKRNDVPLAEMAVYSWKAAYGGFTGVCDTCIKNEL
jgi:hypothetical protein